MNIVQTDPEATGVSADVETLYRDGIVGKKGAFARDWVDGMREDMMTAFWAAIQRPRGAKPEACKANRPRASRAPVLPPLAETYDQP